VILSVTYLLVRNVLGCLLVPTRREASKDAELLVLRHENAVLRRQIGRVRYQPADRLWRAALSRLIPRHRQGEVFAVTPATLLAWHRRLVARKWDYASRQRPGRPPTAAATRKLVIRMATDNPTWGHRRCKASLSVAISVEDMESLEETLDVIDSPALLASLREALDELATGSTPELSKDDALRLTADR
jgi:putative transposase